jgi:hypothetical protein
VFAASGCRYVDVQTFERFQAPADTFRPRCIGRLMTEEPAGRATFAAEILEVTVTSCELRVYTPIVAGLSARLGVELRDATVWVPVVARRVRRTTHGWTISCVFDRPTASDQRSIYALMAGRNAR